MAVASPPPEFVVIVETNHLTTSSDHAFRYGSGNYVFLWVLGGLFVVFVVVSCGWPMDPPSSWRERDRQRDVERQGYPGFTVAGAKD